MLIELAVTDLGVIGELSLLLADGLTAVTGETGAGKTLVVEAIELLVGGRADASVVRPGADEARIEGRFVVDGDEVVLARVVPRDGRSRAYVDGRLAPVASLAEWGGRTVDLHGQHTHQSLLTVAAQREALDRFGEVDLAPLTAARQQLAVIDEALGALGGDERARAREIDLLRFQVAELNAAAVDSGDEDERLERDEDVLADAVAHRAAAVEAVERVVGDGGAADQVGEAVAALAGRSPFADHESRLRMVAAELADVAADLRLAGEAIDDDPARLEAVTERRHLLHELRRKYGDSLTDVMEFHRSAGERLAELEAHDVRAAELDGRRVDVLKQVEHQEALVGAARRATAPKLAKAVAARLRTLAMPKARLDVEVGADPGDDVRFLLAANVGAPLLPLAKVASGGELARAMLALRLVLSGVGSANGPSTLVFDEVDAGIGGEAATAVGEALGQLGRDRQVLVVTHLPQVAAFADHHVSVTKADDGRTTLARAEPLDGEARVIELARMLSGSPDSATARRHAAELLKARAH